MQKPVEKICANCRHYKFKTRPGPGLWVYCRKFEKWFPYTTPAEVEAENDRRAAVGKPPINPKPAGGRTCKFWEGGRGSNVGP